MVKSFVVIKVIIGVNLLSYAAKRREGMEAREVADVVNDFGRNPIGEGKEEQVCVQVVVRFPLDFTDFATLKGIQQETKDVAG